MLLKRDLLSEIRPPEFYLSVKRTRNEKLLLLLVNLNGFQACNRAEMQTAKNRFLLYRV